MTTSWNGDRRYGRNFESSQVGYEKRTWKRGRGYGEDHRERRYEHNFEPRKENEERIKRSRACPPVAEFKNGTSSHVSQGVRCGPTESSQTSWDENQEVRPFRLATDRETDPHKIQQRQKQIRFGKNTIGYDNYVKAVPRKDRERGNIKHPWTPNPYEKMSKRAFDGLVHKWRRCLHMWDSKVVQL